MNPAPTHHPAEDTLLRHAAGTLAPARSLVIATHLPFCRECQAAVRVGEAVGGALLAMSPPTELAPDALTRALSRLDNSASRTRTREPQVLLADGIPLPDALRGLVRPKWRWLAPGISRMAVDFGGATPAPLREHAWLIRVGPGQSLPDHGHDGWEATCVLSGHFTDTTGKYGPGDVAEMNVSEVHQPVAGNDEACICLIAWEGSLRMRGLLARLAQPLLGI